MLQVRLSQVTPRRHAAGQPDIATDGRTLANRDPPQNRRTGVDHHIILNNRMPRMALLQLPVFIGGEAFGTQRDRLINPHSLANNRGFADHHPSPVIDEETATDLRPRMDVDAGGRVGDFRADPRQQR